MPTPFTCQKCTARLVRSTSRQLKSHKLFLHTQVIPAESRPYPQGRKPQSSAENGSSSLGRDDGVDESKNAWNGEIKKFVPRRRPDVVKLATSPLASNARELKAKVLAASGDFKVAHKDIMELYGLAHTEARHAVGQLGRLLWGYADLGIAASRLDQYLAWKKDFSSVMRKVVSTSSVQDTDDVTFDAASHDTEVVSMRAAWQRMERDKRERLWPQMVLSALESEPHVLPTLIQSTFDPSWCPSYVVEDMLHLLHCRYQVARKNGAAGTYNQREQEIQALGRFILDKCPPRYLALEQSVLALILSPMSTPEAVKFYRLLQTIEHPLHANTLLHFASRFAKCFDTKVLATEILRSLTILPGFDINTPAVASVCTSLLTLNENEPIPDQQAAPDLLFEFLLERGFRPNLLGLTALMRNFCIRGRLDTAWKILDLLLQHGLEPDAHVYSILLNGSKKDLNSASAEQIFNIIRSNSAWSPVLLNDLLDTLFRENETQPDRRRRQRKKVNNAWRPMFRLYAKFYDLAPLQKLTLFPLENLPVRGDERPQYATRLTYMADSLAPQPDNKLMQPDSLTLCLMIGAHMRSILTPKYVVRYCKHFRQLVEQKDPTVMSLLADHGTLLHDIILRALMQFKETIAFALVHVQQMMNAAKEEMAKCGRVIHHHPPSAHTWTIILNGFKNHENTRAAVSIFNIMRNVGHEQPTLATWNALIQAFTRQRNVEGAVKAVLTLEKAGLKPDDRTIQAFNHLPRNLRDQAITRLQEVRLQEVRKRRNNSSAEDDAPAATTTSRIASDQPIQRPRPGPFRASTLRDLAADQEKWNLNNIEAGTRKLRWARLSNEINSDRPLGGSGRSS